MNENIQKIITFSLVDLLNDDIDFLYLKQKEKEKKKVTLIQRDQIFHYKTWLGPRESASTHLPSFYTLFLIMLLLKSSPKTTTRGNWLLNFSPNLGVNWAFPFYLWLIHISLINVSHSFFMWLDQIDSLNTIFSYIN